MKILLVDDHPMIREVLGAVARAVFPEAAVAHAGALAEALEVADVDLLLLDLGLPGCSGLEALAACRQAFPRARIVVVSATEERASIVRALELGAAGYVPKTHAPPLIAAALRLVAEGGTYVPPQALEPAERSVCPLTDRQLDVLRLIAKGLANKEIAARLKISEDTVKRHACAAYATLGVSSRTQAINAVAQRGIRLE